MSGKDTRGPIILPRISEYSSRTEWEAACWRKILESKELLQLLTTSYERHNMITRAAAMEGLAAGKSYRKIGEELWLSPQTISGIKKSLNEKAYRSYLERSKKERKKRIYGSGTKPLPSRPSGRRVRTKYGVLYIP